VSLERGRRWLPEAHRRMKIGRKNIEVQEKVWKDIEGR